MNTVSRRFGSSMLTSLRLFTRAPCTRIRSWLSATCSAGDRVSSSSASLIGPEQPEHVAVGVGDGGHQAAATDVVRGLLHRGACGGHLGQLRLEVRHVPVGHRRGHALRSTARHQPDVLARGLEADVVGRVGLRRSAEQGGVHLLGRLQVGNGMQHGLDSLGGRAGRVHGGHATAARVSSAPCRGRLSRRSGRRLGSGGMDDSRAPALRASDAERERAADALRHAAGEGRLTMEELAERLHSAYGAQTRAELERLVADIAVPGTAPLRRPWNAACPCGAERAARAGSSPS